MHQQDQPATRGTLKRSSYDQTFHSLRRRANSRTSKEHGEPGQHNEFAAPDIGEFGPDRARGGVGEEVCAADPGVTCGAVEVARDGWGGCCYDRGV